MHKEDLVEYFLLSRTREGGGSCSNNEMWVFVDAEGNTYQGTAIESDV